MLGLQNHISGCDKPQAMNNVNNNNDCAMNALTHACMIESKSGKVTSFRDPSQASDGDYSYPCGHYGQYYGGYPLYYTHPPTTTSWSSVATVPLLITNNGSIAVAVTPGRIPGEPVSLLLCCV